MDKESPLGMAINKAADRVASGMPDKMHDQRVELIAAALDVRDDAYEDVMVQLPPEFHEPVHKAITSAVSATLGMLDRDYVVVAKQECPDGWSISYVATNYTTPKGEPSGDVNLAGDLKQIFDTIFDDVNT